jgi:hypothetical protein
MFVNGLTRKILVDPVTTHREIMSGGQTIGRVRITRPVDGRWKVECLFLGSAQVGAANGSRQGCRRETERSVCFLLDVILCRKIQRRSDQPLEAESYRDSKMR